jgi:hypothetical protein
MQMYVPLELCLYALLNLCTRTGVDSSSLPQLYPWNEPPGTNWLGSWVVPGSAVEESPLLLSEVALLTDRTFLWIALNLWFVNSCKFVPVLN